MPAQQKNRNGQIIVNTGTGKGKTTAALGQVMRAWGHGFQVCVIQFMKSSRGNWGEAAAAERMGIDWHQTGLGFLRQDGDRGKHKQAALQGWKLAQERIRSCSYDLVVLDEFTYPLTEGWLRYESVIAWLKKHQPSSMHLVITGRLAPQKLLEYADTATEMQKIKHAFDQGVSGLRGIDY